MFLLTEIPYTAVKILSVQKVGITSAPLATLVFNKNSAGKCHKQKHRITPEVTHFPPSQSTAASVITMSFLIAVCLIC